MKKGVLFAGLVLIVLSMSFISADKYYLNNGNWNSNYCAVSSAPCNPGYTFGRDVYTCKVGADCTCDSRYEHGCGKYYYCGGHSYPTVCSCRLYCQSSGGDGGDGDGGPEPCGGSTPCGSPGSCYATSAAYSWSGWGAYNACSGTFDSASQTRTRSCDSGGNTCGGSNQCSGSSSSSRICTVITNSTWNNLKGEPITNSSVGDTAFMKADGVGIRNQSIDYTVYVLEGASWRNLWGLLGLRYIQNSPVDNPLYTFQNNTEHFFNSKSNNNNGPTEANSSAIPVSSASNATNAMPAANITHPNNADFRFSNDCLINFTQASYDEDDLLRLTWNFGDGVVANSTQNYSLALTPDIANTQHFYSLPGVYTVSLTAAEMARNQSDIDYTTVYILREGINAVPVITLPENGVAYGNWVDFNANQSYVANCTLNMTTPDFMACSLGCKYIHAPGTRNTGTGYDLRMNWTVRDSVRNIELNKSANWSTNYTHVVEFDEFFGNPGQHNAVLSMEYLQK